MNLKSFFNKSLILILALICIRLISCSYCSHHAEVDYNYADITIKRIDECGKTTFYYQNKQEKYPGKIWAEYSGINDGFSGYLIFNDSKKVTILVGDGYFQSENVDTTIFTFDHVYAYNKPEPDSNVYEIILATRYERERNANSNSKVQVTYRENKK
jgi:hypothetical protein